MRIQDTTAHLRARAVTVAILIALGVLVTMGVGHAAPAASGASPTASSAEPKDDKSDGKGKGGGGSKDGKDDKDGHKNGDKGKGGGDKKDGDKGGGDKKDGGKPAEDPNHVKGTPCTKSAHACVDLGAQRAWLIDRDGKVVRGPVPISSGKPGHETPRGAFPVLSKDKDHHSREFDNAPMPNSVFFAEGGIAFHGGDVNRQSSGCVHLDPPDDAAFFDFLAVGDEVQIH